MALWKPNPVEEGYGDLALVISCVRWETKHVLNGSRAYRWRPICACDPINSICTFPFTLPLDRIGRDNIDSYFPQLAWLITFIASIISAVKGSFPNFAWWAIAYLFCVIMGVFVVVGSDATQTYHVAVSNPFLPMLAEC